MAAPRYAPGATWYFMALLAAGGIAYGLGVLLGHWSPESTKEKTWAVVGFIGGGVFLCTLLLGWHRFTVRPDGLYVTDLRGQRRHSWDTLGQPRLNEFGSDSAPALSSHGFRGRTDPQAFSHVLCDRDARPLYRIGPWYPRRRELMREIRRHLRERD